MLVHGLCGCHAAGYMVRFADRLTRMGLRVFRLDMRGCGDSAETCQTITHAGRGGDLVAGLSYIAGHFDGPLGVVGVSLGGNQALRAAGRIGGGHDDRPDWWSRVAAVMAIAPPIDLQACSDRMETPHLRPYNRYFIRHLLDRLPPAMRQNEILVDALARPRPKTLRQFDRQFTAPLAGFLDETQYYRESAAIRWLGLIDRPTLIVAAADDPLVPVSMFQPAAISPSPTTRLLVPEVGGHVGFIQRNATSWMDEVVASCFQAAFRSAAQVNND